MSDKKLTVALAGNPNAGKTTLFNALTGMRNHVGNWPGKTVSVERMEGKAEYNGYTFEIVDLPGTYSLSSRALDEEIAAEYLRNEKPDVVVNIVDAAHLERNLYLTMQLIELGCPLVLALNMNKYAEAEGFVIDTNKLSSLLGVPVVKIEAIDKTGREDLLNAIISKPAPSKILPRYSEELEEHIAEIAKTPAERFDALFSLLNKTEGEPSEIASTRKHIENMCGADIAEVIADARYAYIAGVLHESVHHMHAGGKSQTGRIDRILTNRWLGFPIFALIMYVIFQLVFTLGAPPMEWIETFFGWLGEVSGNALSAISAPDWATSLVVDGIIGGVGGIIVFLPNIIIMFFLLSIMEASGYLARVAVLMDRIMHALGLHGKSFIPMILGFGCSVPAIMATRTLESERDRKLTMLLTPYMSCGARMPVYILFVGIFFAPEWQGIAMFALYFLGIVVALLVGIALRHTVFKAGKTEFVLELPPYRLPTIKGVLLHTWNNAKEFLVRAGTIIFAACLVVWLLASLPFGVEYGSLDSVLGMIGSSIAPIFEPLGFGFAEAAVAIIMGLLAKEVVVGTFGTLFGVGEEALGDVLINLFTPLSSVSFMVFVLLYVPCLAALFTIKKESGSWKFTIFAAVLMLVVAWIVSFIVYQGGLLLGF
ncbi:MAG TPA: ferrous iron transport protein B [Methanocorpusculum sp.]|nr:ferrous iron transport protein B [Methanocorpusculum sp.]